MSGSSTIQTQIQSIQSQLPASVRLIAVTKYVTTAEITAAYEAGIRDFGESRVQDAQEKIQQLSHLSDVQWHLIGHLQSNKAKLAVELFDWIHSVDSLKIAQRLNRLALEQNKRPHICLQVKIRPDPAKFGWHPAELLEDLAALKALTQLQIDGVMVILPQGLDEAGIAQAFRDTVTLAQSVREHPNHPLPIHELSMGMSNDYLLAVEAGATMVRLGRILFPA